MKEDMITERNATFARYCLGKPGRHLNQSKSFYQEMYPDRRVFFNGNVFDSSGNKIWDGDIDMVIDSRKIKELVEMIGEPVFVTREICYRKDSYPVHQLESDAKYEPDHCVKCFKW